MGSRLGHWDDKLDEGLYIEPSMVMQGHDDYPAHKVYRKDSCTLDHRVRNAAGELAPSVPARRYFGLWQCGCCGGIVAPKLRRIRTIRVTPIRAEVPHANGNGNGHRRAA